MKYASKQAVLKRVQHIKLMCVYENIKIPTYFAQHC